MEIPLPQQLEAILFFKGQPMSLDVLAKVVGADKAEARDALEVLDMNLQKRGIILTHHENKYMLRTHPDVAGVIESLHDQELQAPLSSAASETFAIIAYMQPITKAEVDHIRGVNSQYSLRHLLIRGLIQKKQNPEDKRRPHYYITLDALGVMGVSSLSQLPEYESVTAELQQIMGNGES